MPGRCWEWERPDANGYGSLMIEEKRVMAHRLAYELAHGPIAEGLHIDHLCRNPRCVRPSHLEPVTQRVNTARGMSPNAIVVAVLTPEQLCTLLREAVAP